VLPSFLLILQGFLFIQKEIKKPGEEPLVNYIFECIFGMGKKYSPD